ncbi:MAG: translation initiation factor IF-2 [Chthoniobacterales bacterium]|nr:translation initiation factor IF-2 [Chthoniobacterales bacterium]
MPAKAPAKKTAATKPAPKTASRARGAKAEPEAPKAAAPKPAPKPKVEVVSLIDKPSKKKPAPEPVEVPVAAPEPAPVAEVVSSEPEVTEDGKKIINIKPPIVVKDLAVALGIKAFVVIKDLMDLNIFANLNQTIDPSVASQICEKHGFTFEKEKRQAGAGVHKAEPVVAPPPEPVIDEKKDDLESRPPVITFMGHVDHGKTSLMDHIRKARVAAGEAGGITQHIGAYSVEHGGHRITFLDTPGHAAFTAMRARGANVTDIVVLVVAADDGIMPQTEEAISHAKAAGVTIIVAVNKIDLPSANLDRVKQQLQEHDLTPEDWGGSTIVCPVSATKGTGVDQLLEMMNLQAEVLELKSSAKVPARATIIEAEMEPGRGPTATVIVKMGTLKVGQAFLCGLQWGKVKSLINDLGKPVKEAGPATPVKILGFDGLPKAGDELVVMESERAARTLSEERQAEQRTTKLAAPQRATLESLFDNLADNQRKVLRVVLKADVQGSLEALVQALEEIKAKQIDLEIIHAAVGPVTESDILLGTASDAIVVGFGVKVENSAATAAKREGVQIKLYSIIYELIDQLKEAMAGMLEPELREAVIGHAEVRQVFDLTKGMVAGCMVTDGRILRTARARVLRRKQPIYDGGISTLRRFKDDVKEVRNGFECGIKLGDYSEYEQGDIIECYTLEKVAQKLE